MNPSSTPLPSAPRPVELTVPTFADVVAATHYTPPSVDSTDPFPIRRELAHLLASLTVEVAYGATCWSTPDREEWEHRREVLLSRMREYDLPVFAEGDERAVDWWGEQVRRIDYNLSYPHDNASLDKAGLHPVAGDMIASMTVSMVDDWFRRYSQLYWTTDGAPRKDPVPYGEDGYRDGAVVAAIRANLKDGRPEFPSRPYRKSTLGLGEKVVVPPYGDMIAVSPATLRVKDGRYVLRNPVLVATHGEGEAHPFAFVPQGWTFRELTSRSDGFLLHRAARSPSPPPSSGSDEPESPGDESSSDCAEGDVRAQLSGSDDETL